MSTNVLINPALLFDGYDLSGDTSRMALLGSATEVDFTNFASGGWSESKPGIRKSAWQQEGYFNAQPTDEQLFSKFGGSAIAVSLAAQNAAAEGEVAYTGQMVTAQYEPGGAVGEAFRFSAGGFATGPLVRGIVAHRAARTTTGTGTIFNLGAVAAGQRVSAALHVLAASGSTPTLDVVIQSAAAVGFGSPTSRLTFAQATGVGGQWLSAPGAITDGYWRVSWTIGGSSPSFTFAIVLGIQ